MSCQSLKQAWTFLSANFGIYDIIQAYILDTLVFQHPALVFHCALVNTHTKVLIDKIVQAHFSIHLYWLDFLVAYILLYQFVIKSEVRQG